jgi:phosphoribosylformimino-5-aminoimidazole carboxamide ribotide isomerase
MIVIPAVDLREGACVQLIGGAYDRERLRIADPFDAVRAWERCGFHSLHLVDLDGATGRGSNRTLAQAILGHTELSVQVGGGVRDVETIEDLVQSGAVRVILGTRALEDMDWLSEMASAFPDTLILSADVRERWIVTHGWQRSTPIQIMGLIEDLRDVPLAALMVTAVHCEGRLKGTDLTLMEDAVESSAVPVFAAGGITSINDLRALADGGVSAAVVGTALYTGDLDSYAVAAEFAE